MKFGVAIVPQWPAKEVLGLVQLADEAGFDNAWICDQTFFADPFPLLTAAGQKIKHIQLGVGVTNPYTRPAYQVARSAGVVGEILGAPINLGIGAGNRRELLLPLGMEQTAPATRIREMIEITRRLLDGETVTYESENVTLKNVKLDFQASQPVKMFVAARGPTTLQLSGEIGDGVIIGDLISNAGLAYAFEEINKGLKKSGRGRNNLETISWTTCFVTDKGNDVETTRAIRPWVAHNLAASPAVVQAALGMDQDRVEVMRSAYAKGGAEEAGKYVEAEDIDKLSIMGSPERCAETIKRISAQGIDQLSILMFSKKIEENTRLIRRLSEEVFPRVK